MSKKTKKVNPYEKKRKRSLKITRKQWTAIIALLSVVVLIAGIILAGNLSRNDDHYEGDGHNHNEHYEGDGHDHGHSTGADKVKYRYYTNADKTYRVQVTDANNKVLFEKDKLTNVPIKKDLNDTIVELSWATGSSVNEFDAIYWNKKTGKLTELFWAPIGTDGVHIAYPSDDQTKIIVQDLFDRGAYYEEYVLENATEKDGNIIVGRKLNEDDRTVLVTYNSSKTETPVHLTIKLYE